MKNTKLQIFSLSVLLSASMASADTRTTIKGELIDHFEVQLESKISCSLSIEGMTNGSVTFAHYIDARSFEGMLRENNGKARILIDIDSSVLKSIDLLDIWTSSCDQPGAKIEYFAVLKDGSQQPIDGGALSLKPLENQ